MPDQTVAFLDVGATYSELRDEMDAAVHRVLASGWFLLGEELASFEEDYAGYTGARHCVGVGSGLDALTLALRAVEIGPGDEVIVPSNTYIATWLAVSAVGATPVPVEPDPDTHNIDPDRIEAAATANTKAVLPVHLYGRPAPVGRIREIADQLGLKVVEDAAQAHGAWIGDEPVGAVGDAVCWSFYPGKNLGAFGDGGAVTANDPDITESVRLLRNYGSKVKYVNEERGVNSRLDELQAAVLAVKLRHLDEWNQRRRRIADHYLAEFRELDSDLCLPTSAEDDRSSWHLFVVRHPRRDELQRRLSEAGIQTMIHYPIPPHRQRAYADLEPWPNLPIAERLATEVLSLPIGPHMTDGQVEHVVRSVRSFA